MTVSCIRKTLGRQPLSNSKRWIASTQINPGHPFRRRTSRLAHKRKQKLGSGTQAQKDNEMATHVIPKEPLKSQPVATPQERDWTKPQAMAIPKEGYLQVEQGRYGQVYPRTPACHGFSVIGKVKPGREQAMREYGKNVEAAVQADPFVLAPLKLHYLRWVLFDV